MQNEEKIVIKPAKPWFTVGTGFFFLVMTVMLFNSKYLDLAMGILATFTLSVSLLFFWMTDRGFMNILFLKDSLRLTGYFSIRHLNIKYSDIKGYELKEAVNQFESLHKQIGLRTNQGQLIVFPKAAYSNYSELADLIASNFNLIEYKPLKNAEFYNKWISIIGTISGILALLVGILKFIK